MFGATVRFVLWAIGYLICGYILYSIGSYLHVNWYDSTIFIVGAIVIVAIALLLAWLISYVKIE